MFEPDGRERASFLAYAPGMTAGVRVAGDLDGDGRADVVTTAPGRPVVRMFAGSGAGLPTGPVELRTFDAEPISPGDVFVG